MLDVSLIFPEGNYTPPADLVRSASATFGICPSETVISSNTQTRHPPLKAVATLLEDDTSAIVTLKSSGLDRPSQLDGKIYASYAARYEGRVVQEIIRADGGKGDFMEATPAVMGIWDTLLKGDADATWIFTGWEGVDAQLKGVDLNVFKLADYGIPYGYTPVLVALPQTLQEKPDVVRAFLRATARGFQYAAQHPAEAAKYLLAAGADSMDEKLATASQEMVSMHYLDAAGRWGHMQADRWDKFLDWLDDKGLLTSAMPSRNPVEGVSASLDDLRAGKAGQKIPRSSVNATDLFTNEFLPSS
ncbi:g359 [Coccomyxa elongata]